MAGLADAHRAVKFATVDANVLAVRPVRGTPLQGIMSSVIRASKARLGSFTSVELLFHARRVKPDLLGGLTDRVLVTVTSPAALGVVAGADIEALIATSQQAMDRLTGAAAGDVTTRDEELQALSSAIISKGEISITRAAPRRKQAEEGADEAEAASDDGDDSPPTSSGGSRGGGVEDGDMTPAQRRARRARIKKERAPARSGGRQARPTAAAAPPTPAATATPMSAADVAAAERARRLEMDAAAEDAGFVPQLADDAEARVAAASRADDDMLEEGDDVVDLDAVGDYDEDAPHDEL